MTSALLRLDIPAPLTANSMNPRPGEATQRASSSLWHCASDLSLVYVMIQTVIY